MRIQVLELDGSIPAQQRLLQTFRPHVHDLRHWGPRIRIACRWPRFRRFERALDRRLGRDAPERPALTFLGSGDFHHVSLALLRRLREPFNLLVIDKHPDWVQAVPLLHCGTWLSHAARLPQVRQIFHVGGETDFDNAYRWLAPQRLLRSGKVVVFPAGRTFRAGFWPDVPHVPVRPNLHTPVNPERIERLLWPYREVLQRWPLYVSLDKDVLIAPQAPVNWDSGLLLLEEVQKILHVFCRTARHRLLGMDLVGDWSPVVTRGWFRSLLHWVEHPSMQVDPEQATRCNQAANLALTDLLLRDQEPLAGRVPVPVGSCQERKAA